ncbi:hypothetical protein FD39_GL001000 [Lactobacillus amylolyticus DSM 11664]|nr:hypothetical protein FD39_GL001000 [Lactobacillus amylolyticus DSM 11664]
MDIETSYELVKSAFSAFKKHPASNPFTLQFVSWIAVNFLIAATMRRRMNLTCGSQLSF